MNVFYSTEINGDKIKLIDQEAQHCIKVLRKSRGEEILVIDGKGRRFSCEIVDHDRRSVSLHVNSQTFVEKELHLPHLAFGLIKNQTRLEWMLEKVTEIGVGRISPLLCTRSERSSIKKERLQKILVSATKQSLNPYLPILEEPVKLQDYLIDPLRAKKYVASYGDNIPELSSLSNRQEPSVILIGPEGDFTDQELRFTIEKDFQRVNLGHSRLRAETACIVSCTLMRYT